MVGGCIGKPSASLFCASRFSRLLFGSGFCGVGVYDRWFKQDIERFIMNHLMRKRLLDIAGYLGRGCKVGTNGERLPIKST